MIEAVTFDLWNTVLSDMDYSDFRIVYLAKVLTEQNIFRSYDEIREAYFAAHEYAHKVWKEESYRYISTDDRLKHTLGKLKVDLPTNLKSSIVKEFKEAILRRPPPLVEGANEVLEFLRPNCKLGIISDSGITPGKVLRRILDKEKVLDFFDVTVFSDEVGYNKPHTLIFKTALKGLVVEPSEATHVGDLLQTDIAGAKNVGMKAVWFNRKGSVEKGQYSPDFEIQTLLELIHILKEIS